MEAWSTGRLDGRALAEWAQEEVDQWLLPDVAPDDPVSVEVEVLLQLSTLHLGALRPERDGRALLTFLDTPPEDSAHGWARWYRHLRGEATPTLPHPSD